MTEETAQKEQQERKRGIRRPGTVYKKEDFVPAFAKTLEIVTGQKFSDAQVWEIFKASFYQACSFGHDKPLTLAGIGKFKVVTSKWALNKGAPPLRLKITPSDPITRALNGERTPIDIYLESFQRGEEEDDLTDELEVAEEETQEETATNSETAGMEEETQEETAPVAETAGMEEEETADTALEEEPQEEDDSSDEEQKEEQQEEKEVESDGNDDAFKDLL